MLREVPPAADAASTIRPPRPLSRLEQFRSHSDLIAVAVIVAGFCWRLWLARATFLNTDEAWHFTLANQSSAALAYKASLTITHPPLLILVLHFWRSLGASELMLRLPAVIAGSAFCWIFYRWLTRLAGPAAAWAGLILATFLDPMIYTSAEVRQNPLLLVFSVGSAYLLEIALTADSVLAMSASAACVCLAMLSHYAGFFVAGALGGYTIVRLWQNRPSNAVVLTWVAGQVVGGALAVTMYKTHLRRLNSLISQPLLPRQYLTSWYFHPGKDHLLPFLYRGTFGVFRFIFGQTQIGQLAALMFVAGMAVLLMPAKQPPGRPSPRVVALLLVLPFVLTWVAAAASMYPYGRMRHSLFLAISGIAGVSICLARITRERTSLVAALACVIVICCHLLGTPQDRDRIPLADQKREHMDQALQFIRSRVSPDDVILTDKATSYQLEYYLCRRQSVQVQVTLDQDEFFACDGFQLLTADPSGGALTPDIVADMRRGPRPPLSQAHQIWVVQGGWGSGLGETLRNATAGFSQLEIHSFGRYLEVFPVPMPALTAQHSR